MKKVSYTLNVVFTVFISWYFFIHVGINYYINRYIYHKELFLEDAYYRAKVDSYGKLNTLLDRERKYIVIAGDSLVAQFPTDELFADYKVLNRGIGKDTSRGLLDRVDTNINTINIASCFIMIGHNDLKYREPASTIENIKKILNKIKSDKVFFLSILPDKDRQSNIIVAGINNSIKEFCLTRYCDYVDFFERFIDDDYTYKEKYYYDGVHLTVDGYKIMAELLEKIFQDITDL